MAAEIIWHFLEGYSLRIGDFPTPKKIRDGYQYYTKAKMNSLRKAGYKKDFLTIEQGVKDYIKNYLLK